MTGELEPVKPAWIYLHRRHPNNSLSVLGSARFGGRFHVRKKQGRRGRDTQRPILLPITADDRHSQRLGFGGGGRGLCGLPNVGGRKSFHHVFKLRAFFLADVFTAPKCALGLHVVGRALLSRVMRAATAAPSMLRRSLGTTSGLLIDRLCARILSARATLDCPVCRIVG